MEEVAEAGGWEEHHIKNLEKELALLLKQKEVQKAISDLSKIEKDEWVHMSGIITGLKSLGSGSDLGILGGVSDSIKDTLRTELNSALAPFKNELNNMINQLLAPFLPLIQGALNEVNTLIARGTGAIEALLTGKFDQFMQNLQLELQPEVHAWKVETSERFYDRIYEMAKAYPNNAAIQQMFYNAFHMTLAEYEALQAGGVEGGVYSGQFDIDMDALADALANLNLPNFSDEEED